MANTLTDTYAYGLELLDKKGSDFVQLPEFFRTFKSATLDFIGERIPIIERTQQVVNDLRPLMDTKKWTVIPDPDDVYARISAIPEYVHHLVRANPVFTGNVTSRQPKLIRHGNLDAFNADPYKRSSMEYSIIMQYGDYVKIYSGYNDVAIGLFATFLHKPTYADINTPSQEIVNLPEVAVEDILNKTIVKLMVTRADDRTQLKMVEEQSFRNRNK